MRWLLQMLGQNFVSFLVKYCLKIKSSIVLNFSGSVIHIGIIIDVTFS